MKAKRLSLVVLIVFVVALLAGSVSAAERKIGHLSKLNITAEELQKNADAFFIKNGKTKLFTLGEKYTAITVFYDSLTSMVMALNAGEVDEISLPEPVADYVMNLNDNFEISTIVRIPPASLTLGFRKDIEPELRGEINKALRAMNAEGSIAILRAKYIDHPGVDDPEPVKFDHFDGANTVKVAVTGDLPPIDFLISATLRVYLNHSAPMFMRAFSIPIRERKKVPPDPLVRKRACLFTKSEVILGVSNLSLLWCARLSPARISSTRRTTLHHPAANCRQGD